MIQGVKSDEITANIRPVPLFFLLVGFKKYIIVKIQLPEDFLTTNCLQN